MSNVPINAKKEAHDQGKMGTRNKRFHIDIKVSKRDKFISLHINVPTGNTLSSEGPFCSYDHIPKVFINSTTPLTTLAKNNDIR